MRPILIFSIAILIASIGGASILLNDTMAIDDTEYYSNDNVNFAERLDVGTYHLNFTEDDRVDWFKFYNRTVDNHLVRFHIGTEEDHNYLEAWICDREGSRLRKFSNHLSSEHDMTSDYIFDNDEPFIEVRSIIEMEYTLTIEMESQNDANSNSDQQDDPTSIGPGINTGTIGDDDHLDMYRIEPVKGKICRISARLRDHNDIYEPQGATIEVLSSDDHRNGKVLHDLLEDDRAEWTISYDIDEQYPNDFYVSVWTTGGIVGYAIEYTIEDQDDGGTGSDATHNHLNSPVITEGEYEGYLHSYDDEDNYRFLAGGGQTIDIMFGSPGLDSQYLYLSDSKGPVRDWDTKQTMVLDSKDGSERINYLTDSGSDMEWYTVRIIHRIHFFEPLNPGSYGEYEFKLQLLSQNDSGTGMDAPEGNFTNIKIPDFEKYEYETSSVTIKGELGGSDTSDCYLFPELPRNDPVFRFKFERSTGPFKIELFTENKYLYSYRNYEPKYNEMEIVTFNGLFEDDMQIYFKIYVDSDKRKNHMDYELTIDTWNQSDGDSGMDAPQVTPFSNEEYTNVTLSRKLSGFIGGRYDPRDIYKVEVQKGKTMTYVVTPTIEETLELKVYMRTYTRSTEIGTVEGGPGESVSLTYQPQSDGSMYLVIEALNGWGHYRVEEERTYQEPYLDELLGVGANDRNVIFWTVRGEEEQITGFEIYRVVVGYDHFNQHIETIEYNETIDPFRLIYDPYARSFEDYFPTPGVQFYYKVVPRIGYEKLEGKITIAEASYTPGDEDQDGIPDVYEYQLGLDPEDRYDGGEDLDKDGFSNYAEYIYGSNPLDRSSTPETIGSYDRNREDDMDLDGMDNDWEELHGLDPMDASDAMEDPDEDGITNLEEYYNKTNPNRSDIDEGSVENSNVDDEGGSWPILLFLAILMVMIILAVFYNRRRDIEEDKPEEQDHLKRGRSSSIRSRR